MTAVLSPSSSSRSSSPHPSSTSPNPSHKTLPPLVTTPTQRRPPPGVQRPSAYALNRMSAYSTNSNSSQKPSRPPSHVILPMSSSLPYSQVRDFAYPIAHPYHYGPPAESSAATSGRSTPAFDISRRLSDPPTNSWNPTRLSWSASAFGPGEHLPQMAYGGSPKDHGPPYSEDEDLQSPVVVSSRSRKNKEQDYDQERGYFTGVNGDGSETYYVSDANEMADGPGGELVTYPADQARHSHAMLHPNSYGEDHGPEPRQPRGGLSVGSFNESRYSRDYQFTIASPDEEMHGKAVALFDFVRENENELPLVEGQVIWVSYRHGQGWLVAQDPKSEESGLVPEEYVRLLKDIEGDWSALSSDAPGQTESIDESEELTEQQEDVTTEKAESTSGHKTRDSTGSNGEKKKPMVSTFSTSSKDLDPYPHPLLGTQTGQQPPQVVHYGSQANTPTLSSPAVAKKVADKNSVSRSSSRREENRR